MPTVTLHITPAENQPGKHLVVVNGTGFFNSIGARVGVRIKGEDTWRDDSLFALRNGYLTNVIVDGSFVMSDIVAGSRLNEDLGGDEIYAIANIEGYGDVRSNTFRGKYG